MFSYSCFGEHIISAVPLPLDRATAVSTPPIRILSGGVLSSDYSSNPPIDFEVREDTLHLYYPQLGAFALSRDNGIQVFPETISPKPYFYRFIAMNILALSLAMRERLVLHGSSVIGPAGQMLLMGDSGAGKSTLALGLHRQERPLVCDDVSVINLAHSPYVERGVPYLKAWPDTLSAMNIDATSLSLLSDTLSKRIVPFTPATATAGLSAICVLEIADVVSLEPLPFSAAFEALIRHTFMPRSIDILGLQRVHFSNLAALLKQVQVYRITRTPEFQSLQVCVDLIKRTFI